MTNEATINKLIEMRMTAMADAYRIQLKDTTMVGIAFDLIIYSLQVLDFMGG